MQTPARPPITDAATWKYKPNSIQIELVQGCNRKCSFCGCRGIEQTLHKADRMTVHHTCKLIKEANLNCRIILAGHGEPTLHQDVVSIVRDIRLMLPENTIHLLSNGSVLAKKPELLRQLFSVGLNDLVIDEYEDTAGIGTVIAKNAPVVPCVHQGAGVPMFAPKGTDKRICINKPITLKGNTLSRRLCNHCGAGMPPAQTQEKTCSIIFRDMLVRWDGNIAICCNDFRGEYPVCNITKCRTLREAYLHERLEAARRMIMAKDRSFHPCDICDVAPIRPGLLPDHAGKVKLPPPTEKDKATARERRPALAIRQKREWEK